MLILNDQLRHHLEHWDDEPNDDENNDEKEHERQGGAKDYEYDEKESEREKESEGNNHCFGDKNFTIKQNMFPESWLLFVILLYLLLRGRYTIDSPEMLVLLLSFFKMIVDQQKQVAWPLLMTRSKERSSLIKKQRLALSGLLAENGAPPINNQYGSDGKLLPEQLTVARVYQEYLSVVDNAIERLQSATSINLGLGIWSPVVHRVRSDKKRFIASRSKRILAHGLLHSLNYCSIACSGDNDEKEAEPEVVTISWLQYIRREKLPLSLTEHLEKISTLEELQKYRYCIEENTSYIRSCFFDIENISKRESSYPLLELVARQLHAAEIVLWAYCNEENKNKDLTRRHQWLEQFDSLLRAAQAINDDALKNTKKNNFAREAETESLLSGIEKKQENPNSFEDMGVSPSFNNPSLKNELDCKETLVYSGKGSLLKDRRVYPEPGLIQQSNNIRSKAFLFQELQSRLAEFDKVPEISICPDDDGSDECDRETERSRNNEEIRQAFTLSGRLLSELQSSIGPVSKDGDAIG